MNHGSVISPFIAGLITDIPDWQVPGNGAVLLQDFVDREGVATQRSGWTNPYTVVGTGVELRGVAYNRFGLANTTRSIQVGTDGSPSEFTMSINGGSQIVSGIGTPYDSGEIDYLPRAVYRDELLLCHTAGRYPLIRYSGSLADHANSGAATCTTTTGKSTLTATSGTWAATMTAGSYVRVSTRLGPPSLWLRVTRQVSTTVLNLEGVQASVGRAGLSFQSNSNSGNGCIGFTYPCIPVYQAGTISIAAGAPATVTGTGTEWNTDPSKVFSGPSGDAMLFKPSASVNRLSEVVTVTSDTSITLDSESAVTDAAYQILRRCPFRDVTVQHECLFGSGVEYRKNTVFIMPPGWNPALPPGAIEPFDFMDDAGGQSPNPGYFQGVEIDVPGPFDGDRTVGLLAAEGIVLVIKEQGVFGIFGSLYPDFSQQRIPTGDGNGAFYGGIGPTSVMQLPSGPFWAGPAGVFTYAGGRVINLTDDKINREWRDLVRDGSTDVCLAEVEDHLLVCVYPGGLGVGSGTTYQLNLRTGAWSTVSNIEFRHSWSAGPDGSSYLVDTLGDYGIIDALPMYQDADGSSVLAVDAQNASTAPQFIGQTGAGLHLGDDGFDSEARLVDVHVLANIRSSTGTNPTVTVEHIHGDGRGLHGGDTDITKTIGAISADTTNRTDRTNRMWSRRTGKRHSIKVTASVSSNARNVEIHGIAPNFRKHRKRT